MNGNRDYIAEVETTINAPIDVVWDALTNPKKIKAYMYGTNVKTDWQKGSTIIFEGLWEGKKYEDKGMILENELHHTLSYTHFSNASGLPDIPENYHTVTFHLHGHDIHTHLTLTQTNNRTEEAKAHSEKNWNDMLSKMKALIEA